MNKRILSMIMALLFLALPMLSACSQQDSVDIQATDQPAEREELSEDTSSTEAINTSDNEKAAVISVDGYFGRMSFTPEEGNTAASNCGQSGTKLSVTDSSGLTWTLSVPEGALFEGQETEISLNPLRDISNSTLPCEYSGLLLSPDGTAFLKPATLTVSGPGAENLILLSGDHEGAQLNFLPTQSDEHTVTTEIWHFSSAFAVDPTKADGEMEIKEFSTKFAEKVFSMSEQVLGEKINAEVPDIDLAYMTVEDYRAFQKSREKDFLKPEFQLSFALAMIPKLLEKAGIDDRATAEKAWNYFQPMYERYFKKIDAFLEDYRNDRGQIFIMDFLNGINTFAVYLPVAFGDFVPAAEQNRLREKMDQLNEKYNTITREWANEAWNDTLKDVREKHQYKYIMALYVMAMDFSALLSIDFKEFQEYIMLSDAQDALAFRITYEGEITGSGDGVCTWEFDGDVPVEFTFEQGDYEFIWEGDGECGWTGFEGPEQLGISPTPETAHIEMKLLTYPEKYGLSITFDNLTPSQINYTTPIGVLSTNHNYITAVAFVNYYTSEGVIAAQMDLENGEEEMDVKMQCKAESLEGLCEFTFTHEPRPVTP